jgi:putative endonuclease
MKSNSYKTGLLAELLAAVFLLFKGYRILAWRFKTSVGEVDIIAKKGAAIVFVEVKSRPALADGLAAISPQNASRVRRAAEWWLKSHPRIADKCDIRFDAVVLAHYARIQHLQNAF